MVYCNVQFFAVWATITKCACVICWVATIQFQHKVWLKTFTGRWGKWKWSNISIVQLGESATVRFIEPLITLNNATMPIPTANGIVALFSVHTVVSFLLGIFQPLIVVFGLLLWINYVWVLSQAIRIYLPFGSTMTYKKDIEVSCFFAIMRI